MNINCPNLVASSRYSNDRDVLLEPLTPHQKRILLPTNYSRQLQAITKGYYLLFFQFLTIDSRLFIHATVAQFHLELTRRSMAIPLCETVPKNKWNRDVPELGEGGNPYVITRVE